MKLIYLEWVDSVSQGGNVWANKDRVECLTADRIRSVGWVARETKDAITIISHDGDSQWSGDMCIPKCAIKKRRLLKAP